MSLVRVEYEPLYEQVKTALYQTPEVVAAYLYGSALDKCRPDSDLNIAIFVPKEFNERIRDFLEIKLLLELPPLEGHSFDLKVINFEDFLLAFHILKEGRALIVTNQDIFGDLIEEISLKYLEYGAYYQAAIQEILEEVFLEMTLNRDFVIQKTGYVKEQTSALRNLVESISKEEILSDPWIIRGVKYSLQTAVEACIELSYHVCAKQFGQAPVDSHDSLRYLCLNEIISEAEMVGYSSMFTFRTRLIHGNQDISNERLYRIISENLEDLELFTQYVLKLLKAERSELTAMGMNNM